MPDGKSSKSRFPENGIMSLPDLHRRHDLAGGTGENLDPRDLIGPQELDSFLAMPLEYGASRRDPELRALIGARCGIDGEKPLMTQGAAVERFYDSQAQYDLQISDGRWFGEDQRILRIGFGYLPLRDLEAALGAFAPALGD
ncbi:hypothetical protein [Denitrobaculum tricleocarpae]|uniref:Uncharacterized protein n=1 Tax=Denitrobaculum tricleocarpae TaxID=2591009 RepID=A0A545U2X6_9PROT|nr:hypothetical protein [Denitrobaculum tricleocarpae]TQV83837.1 hypothetical protein FKG95_04460 [Denitrobaculum tricleocarpae]